MKQDFIDINDRRDSPNISIYQSIGDRQEQEDRYTVSRLTGGTLIMVADGHGNEKTAKMIANNVTHIFSQRTTHIYQ